MRTLTFLLVFIFSQVGLLAQLNPMTRERQLLELDEHKGGDPVIDGVACGSYLHYWPQTVGLTPPGPRIAYVTEGMKGDPEDANMMFAFLKSIFVVIVDNKKVIPTAQVTMVGNKTTKITLRMSEEDRKEHSSCLP